MDGNLISQQTKILNAIANGELRRDEVEKELNRLIALEINRTDQPADMELINQCQDLLYRLHHKGTSYCSQREKSLTAAKKKLSKLNIQRLLFHNVLRVAAMLVVIMVGTLMFEQLKPEGTLRGQSTQNEQQYKITGDKVIQGSLIDQVQADENGQYAIINSSALAGVIDLWGKEVEIPTWLPEGWIPLDYFATVSKYSKLLRIQYQQESTGKLIKYSITRYEDIDTANAMFEQNKDGNEHIIGDKKVYTTQNYDSTLAIWIKKDECYSLSGPLTIDEIIQIIESTQRSVVKHDE